MDNATSLPSLNDDLAEGTAEAFGGMRMTKQRKVVYEVLSEISAQHPTASEVFVEATKKMPNISLATVYNCLEAMTDAGVISQVNVDREASRFCANRAPHAHFYCTQCSRVFDIELSAGHDGGAPWHLPAGSRIDELNVSMKGVFGSCPHCAEPESSAK